MALPQEKQSYTFADYLASNSTERWELLDGDIVMMTPPLRIHQDISMEISRQLANYLEGKSCKVYAAPFAVRLFEKAGDTPDDVSTVVEPDISVICDKSKLDQHGCKGAPDMVIEILSPSTQRHDQLVKLELYQRAGVQEYWIVSPSEQSVRVMLLNKNGLLVTHEVYGKTDIAKVNSLQGCFIEMEKVFS